MANLKFYMKVIILAGGRGTRLPVSCRDIPKPLVQIKDKPILEHQIDLLKKHGLEDIKFSLGHRADQIIDYLDNKYEYVIESKPLGTGGAIKFASQNLKDDFMVVNGDILTDLNFSEFLKSHKNHHCENSIAVTELENSFSYGLIKIGRNKLVEEFLEKDHSGAKGLINAGFYILSSDIFESIDQEEFSIEKDIFPNLAKDKKLTAFVHRGSWIDLGTEERLDWARKNFEI